MRVHIETGILIDYLAQGQFTVLRTASRKGRSPSQLYSDAQETLQLMMETGNGSISALTFYELEEALYKQIGKTIKGVQNAEALRLIACRPILTQAITAARLFDLTTVDLTDAAIETVSNSQVFVDKAIRVADALHVVTAASHGVELIISADRDILRLDGQIQNVNGLSMRCLDTDFALPHLKAVSNMNA